MDELNKRQNVKKEAILVSRVNYTAALMHYGAGRSLIDCQAGLLPHLFQDSEVAKVYDIRFGFLCVKLSCKLKLSRRTKMTYFAKHGLYPYFHDKLVKVNTFSYSFFKIILLYRTCSCRLGTTVSISTSPL